MRKALFAAAAIATMATTVSAVDFGLDIKGGVNLATARGKAIDDFTEEDGVDKKMKLGAVAGIGAKIGLSEMFAIQPEILFSQKGFKVVAEEGDVKMEAGVKLSYLEIPVLAKLSFGAGSVMPHVYAGPSLGINLSSESFYKVEGAGEGFDADETEDVKDETSAIDFGVAFGGGVDIPAGSGRILTDVRYTLGFSNVNDFEGADDYDAKNGALSIMVGYGIDF